MLTEQPVVLLLLLVMGTVGTVNSFMRMMMTISFLKCVLIDPVLAALFVVTVQLCDAPSQLPDATNTKNTYIIYPVFAISTSW